MCVWVLLSVSCFSSVPESPFLGSCQSPEEGPDHLTCPGTCVRTLSVIADLGRGLSPHPLLCTLDVECDVM